MTQNKTNMKNCAKYPITYIVSITRKNEFAPFHVEWIYYWHDVLKLYDQYGQNNDFLVVNSANGKEIKIDDSGGKA